jgi:hypothetical protein
LYINIAMMLSLSRGHYYGSSSDALKANSLPFTMDPLPVGLMQMLEKLVIAKWVSRHLSRIGQAKSQRVVALDSTICWQHLVKAICYITVPTSKISPFFWTTLFQERYRAIRDLSEKVAKCVLELLRPRVFIRFVSDDSDDEGNAENGDTAQNWHSLTPPQSINTFHPLVEG